MYSSYPPLVQHHVGAAQHVRRVNDIVNVPEVTHVIGVQQIHKVPRLRHKVVG